MKVVVPVKQVATLDDEVTLQADGTSVDPDCLDWDLNEWDAFSLEAALLTREGLEGDGHEVVVVTVGSDEAEDGLLACLAKGADRAIRVWDPSLEEADSLGIARVLAAVVGQEAPDLVLCGVQSTDVASGATGVALAGLLDLPHVAVVKRIEYDAAAGVATVDRELEGGLVEALRVPTPALLTVQTGTNEPRYATLRAIKQAKEKPLRVCALEELGLDAPTVAAASGSRIVGLAAPDRTSSAEMIDGPALVVANRILAALREGAAS